MLNGNISKENTYEQKGKQRKNKEQLSLKRYFGNVYRLVRECFIYPKDRLMIAVEMSATH